MTDSELYWILVHGSRFAMPTYRGRVYAWTPILVCFVVLYKAAQDLAPINISTISRNLLFYNHVKKQTTEPYTKALLSRLVEMDRGYSDLSSQVPSQASVKMSPHEPPPPPTTVTFAARPSQSGEALGYWKPSPSRFADIWDPQAWQTEKKAEEIPFCECMDLAIRDTETISTLPGIACLSCRGWEKSSTIWVCQNYWNDAVGGKKCYFAGCLQCLVFVDRPGKGKNKSLAFGRIPDGYQHPFVEKAGAVVRWEKINSEDSKECEDIEEKLEIKFRMWDPCQ
ncbi:hypothetical protein BJ508DRAFT_303293 [Ascobolus immersus RN42]|uniref:Uncharacterized protein n=1 Tax=Ascobolus immersus RN42 TaxID=1160509 RepID=A0A3N4IJL4_ASCIM|nr:hypothetical protein BJ508DRAFT_303293 [Ascobolus immersus RN42]